jgi:hypothetical protein
MVKNKAQKLLLTTSAALTLAIGLTGCNAVSGSLSETSKCSDWNNADVNAQGTYLQAEYKKMPQLNAYAGYASGGVSQYCRDNPAASLGDITRKVAGG